MDEEWYSNKLDYQVVRHSSHSGRFLPDHILTDNPSDQSSRWSSDSNCPPQFLILRLSRPAIIKSIKFGKFDKPHVCNLRKFKIYGGLTEGGLVQLLDGGLRNDSQAETFALRHFVDEKPFPCLVIKIVPLQAWGPTFNYSIWFVELQGDDRPPAVQPYMDAFNEHQRKKALRLCMKFLRDHDQKDICVELQKRTQVLLEDPLVTQLHELIVERQDYENAEKLVQQCADDGLFDEFLSNQPYDPLWSQLCPDSGKPLPGMRGGHQMVLDSSSQTIYLFGGWDGCQDLSDFWSYDISTDSWTCICEDTEKEGGPSARSCHKMVLDPLSEQIFVLGKYVESCNRSVQNVKGDFYSYHIGSKCWQLLSDDTHSVGGPRLLYDHQLAIDCNRSIIYCFGGKIISAASNPNVSIDEKLLEACEQQYSDLYSYHIPTNSWSSLRDQCNLRSRSTHSFIFHPVSNQLYIFAGQRFKEALDDFLIYDVTSDSVMAELDRNGLPIKMPEGLASTQRSTLDPILNEIYVLCGPSPTNVREAGHGCAKNSLWVYNIGHKQWSCVYEQDNSWSKRRSKDFVPDKEELMRELTMRRLKQQHPCPRYAHQLVYDTIHKVHYLFGGNPGTNTDKMRLDDFWKLQLNKQSVSELTHHCIWELRKMRFLTLSAQNKIKALEFLQTKMAEITDKHNPDELHHLASRLFDEENGDLLTQSATMQLFESIIKCFPSDMRPPDANLIDLVTL